MKITFLLFLLFYGITAFGQGDIVDKPSYVIIANEKIITESQLNKYGEQGLVKGMHKGVTEEEREKLEEKFGEIIGDGQFVILIDLYAKAEQDSLQIITDSGSEEVQITPIDDFKLHVNDQAKDFNVQLTSGESISLSSLKGKVVLLDFWATWCAPCIMEFYDIYNQILIPLNDSNLVFLPISIGEDKNKVLKKIQDLKQKGLYLNAGIDKDKTIWDSYANGAIPKTFVIDKNGVIRFVSVGNSDENINSIQVMLNELLFQ